MMLFSILTSFVDGKGGIACLFIVFFCEAASYPIIFSIATADLGRYYKVRTKVQGVQGRRAET